MSRLAVIAPVFNDSACLPPLLRDLARGLPEPSSADIYIIDDGSTEALKLATADIPASLKSVTILRLSCNLGHQRAIAIGIVEASKNLDHEALIVVDADGEDRPQDIPTLLAAHESNPEAIVVAQRRSRQEAVNFRVFYTLYKFLFRTLTGRKLDFGNYSVLPIDAADRLTHMTELWNHYPATIMRSRLPVVRVPLDRQHRYEGESRMNFTALVNHGLAGIAAFIDTAFARLLVVAVLFTLLLGGLVMTGVVARLTLGVPIPGWLALGTTGAMIGLIQIAVALVILSFFTLSARSTASPPPASFAADYISSRKQFA